MSQASRIEAPGNRSVWRALSILELLAGATRPLSLGEVAGELVLPKSSTLSLLRALTAKEFATLDDRGRYGLGVRSFEVGSAYLTSMTPVRAVEAELQILTETLGATSHFAVLEHDEVVYLAKHDPPGPGLKLASSLGARLPADTTAVGKVQLAWRPRLPEALPAELAELAELEATRARGYAVDEGITAAGIRCVASAVFNSRGCCGAVGVSTLQTGGPATATLAEAVMRAAEAASVRLGVRRNAAPTPAGTGTGSGPGNGRRGRKVAG
jgi:DNA-binding IclR family transcriptional regulator